MGVFRKKSDPIQQRRQTLNRQIADLQAEISQLSSQLQSTSSAAPLRLHSMPAPKMANANPPPPPAQEPVFEDVSRLKSKNPAGDESTPAHYNDLGVRKFDLLAIWNRFRRNFHGPPTTNPQLVNFLAAGSIKGLRPLRYEKRIARNRFLTFFGALVLVLYGLIYFFMRTH